MNSRQRMLSALAGKTPDMVPVAPSYLHLYLEHYMGRYYLEQYRRRIGGERQLSIDHTEDTLFRANALYQAVGIFEETPDWYPKLLLGSSRNWAENHCVEREGESYFFVNTQNGQRRPFEQCLEMVLSPMTEEDKAGGHQSAHEVNDVWDCSDHLRSLEDVDEAVPITPAEDLNVRGLFEVAKRISRDYGERYFLPFNIITPFSAAYDVVGFAGCMTMIHDQPHLLHRILERKLAEGIELVKCYADAGAHGAWVIEAIAGADLISPQQYDEFAFPYVKSLIEHIRMSGLRTILYFCGDAVPRLEVVRRLNVDAVALEEGKKGFINDLEEIIARIGDMTCVFGNVDAIGIVSQGTQTEIVEEVRRQIHLGKKARAFICGIGSPLPRETNPRKLDAFIRAARRYGTL